MFVYQGKLNWYSYAEKETFVIILPNGPVRVGDSVYLFSQWTKDAQGSKKKNWFQTIIVDEVTQTQATDVTFRLKGAWYSFTVTTQGSYESLSVVMRNPTKGVSDALPLKRIWKSEKELTGTTRIWTGKFSWMHFAKDEPAIFIVPDGFGEGKPILSLWQYTQDSAGKLKDPSFRDAVQKSVSGIDTDVVKFSYHSYYDISCTWEAKTDKLAVHVQEGGHGEDVGSMIRSAIIERQAHTHDFNPPEPTPKKTEVEIRLPQPQPSLPRILGPLPFPKGIIDTLAHTAAFVDQAGYLAKYAQDRFAALDADNHTLVHQLDAARANIKNLETAKEDLISDRDAARAKAKTLEEELAVALQEADELRKEVQKLEHYIHHDKIHDEQARNVLNETQAKLRASQADVTDLRKKLAKAESDIKARDARIAKAGEKVIQQQTTITRLKTELGVKTKDNEELTKEKRRLGLANEELQASNKKSQEGLALAKKMIVDLEKDLASRNKEISGLNKAKQEAESSVEAIRAERDEAVNELHAIKRKELGIDL